MKNQELVIWTLNTEVTYLKLFTGVKTDSGIERFKKAFVTYLKSNDTFETIRDAIKSFSSYRAELKLSRAA